MGNRGNTAVALVALLALSGCSDAPPPAPTPSHASSTAQPPTPSDAAPAPDPDEEPNEPTAMTLEDAYTVCIDFVGQGLVSTGGSFEPASFADSEVAERGDGYFWVWSEYTDSTREPGTQDDSAAHCIVGGTVETPAIVTASQLIRDYRQYRGPDEPIENYSD